MPIGYETNKTFNFCENVVIWNLKSETTSDVYEDNDKYCVHFTKIIYSMNIVQTKFYIPVFHAVHTRATRSASNIFISV